ncbi:MAG: hypothetical protein HMLIMOIP_001083 [Candidatus Nitrosomirales archaeon]|jgi:hypothetical protein
MTVVSTKLSNAEWEKLVDKCNKSGCTIAEYVRRLILREISDNNNERIKKKDNESEVKKLLRAIERGQIRF